MSELVLDTRPIAEEIHYTEIFPAPPQPPHKSYLYKVTNENQPSFIATVIAQSSNGASEGVHGQFPLATISYVGTSPFIMQVNG